MKKSNKATNPFGAMVYGSAIVGERGQIVIPASARKDLKLKAGDRLLVIGKHNKFLGLVKADEMTGILEGILNKLRGNK